MSADTSPVPNATPSPASQPPHEAWYRRPARLLKDSSVHAWLHFLLGICVIVAWWFPARMLYQRYRFLPEVAATRDADTFVALAYEGVSKELSHEVSPKRFDEQLRMLRSHGYVPIGLDDVRRFYEEGRALPRKAVLVSFEQSRKSSYFDARDILRRHRWKAVMFLWTGPITDQDPAALRWPYVVDMAYSGTWDIGLQSDRGFAQVRADPTGRKGNFLTTPQWISATGRYETPDEFERRIREDHERAIAEYARHFKGKPVAFAFPYGDFGQYESRAALTRRINLDLVANYYDLGFVSGAMALNTRHSDPRRLNRLLVNPEWTAADLVERLERAWPVTTEFQDITKPDSETRWITDWGRSSFRPEGIAFSATPATTGAKMWLSGSDLCRNFQCRISFSIEAGQFGVFFRATPDSETYAYFGIDEDGECWLRQKFAGLEPFTLASSRVSLGRARTNAPHQLDLFVRDRVCFVRLDGTTLFREGVILRGEPRPGMVGFNLWDPAPHRASALVSSFSLQNTRMHLAEWASTLNQGPYLSNWINNNAYRLTHICPPWMDISSQGAIILPPWDDLVVNSLSRVYNLELMPRVIIHDEAGLEAVQPDAIGQRIANLKFSGIYINLSEVNTASAAKMLPWLQKLGTSLKKQGKHMLIRFPTLIERTASFSTIAAMIPAATIAANEAPLSGSGPASTNQVTTAETVPAPPRDLNLELYYEITGLSNTNIKPTLEVRREILRREGYTAFAAGEFGRAIESWTQWSRTDPNSEEALMLIGDAYLRMGMEEKAIEFYTRSLALNPGQISLAVRRSRVLEQLGRDEESRDALNLYGRVFPQNIDILIAQSLWLSRHKRMPEARQLIERVLERNPDNLDVLLTRHSLLETPEERFASIRHLIELGSQPGYDQSFGEALLNTDLLATSEASMLANFVAGVARESPDPKVREIYGRLLPRRDVVLEEFGGGKISDNWRIMASPVPTREGRYQLNSGRGQTEAYLRLSRSELMRNGFLDVEIDEARGFFWLYARRSPNAMVRFGFEDSGYLYLQVWGNGNLLVNESRLWLHPRGHLRMRLEIIGDGAMGYVNGQPMFNTPAAIPAEISFGWWGVAPFSAQPGEARALLTRIECGPLPANLTVVVPPAIQHGDDAVLDLLKDRAPRLSALLPYWFPKHIDGTFSLWPEGQTDLYRMLGKYYRSRLLPIVDLEHSTEIPVDWLIQSAQTNNLRGFTLHTFDMPPDEWFDQVRVKLEKSPLDLLVLSGDLKTGPLKLRELHLGSSLLPLTDKIWEVQPVAQLESGALPPVPEAGIAPQVMIIETPPAKPSGSVSIIPASPTNSPPSVIRP